MAGGVLWATICGASNLDTVSLSAEYFKFIKIMPASETESWLKSFVLIFWTLLATCSISKAVLVRFLHHCKVTRPFCSANLIFVTIVTRGIADRGPGLTNQQPPTITARHINQSLIAPNCFHFWWLSFTLSRCIVAKNIPNCWHSEVKTWQLEAAARIRLCVIECTERNVIMLDSLTSNGIILPSLSVGLPDSCK